MDNLPYKIIFEDNNLLAVDKPCNLSVIRERKDNAPFLADLFENILVVHRIDKDTSGVVIFAKNRKTHKELCCLFSGRKVFKEYTACVSGVPGASRGTIDAPLRKFGSGRTAADFQNGKPSLTEYEVLHKFSSAALVKANPHTGRQHQIRAHFYYIGHPLLGDKKYGDKRNSDFPRLMLHASAVCFSLSDGKNYEIRSELPSCFRSFISGLH